MKVPSISVAVILAAAVYARPMPSQPQELSAADINEIVARHVLAQPAYLPGQIDSELTRRDASLALTSLLSKRNPPGGNSPPPPNSNQQPGGTVRGNSDVESETSSDSDGQPYAKERKTTGRPNTVNADGTAAPPAGAGSSEHPARQPTRALQQYAERAGREQDPVTGQVVENVPVALPDDNGGVKKVGPNASALQSINMGTTTGHVEKDSADADDNRKVAGANRHRAYAPQTDPLTGKQMVSPEDLYAARDKNAEDPTRPRGPDNPADPPTIRGNQAVPAKEQSDQGGAAPKKQPPGLTIQKRPTNDDLLPQGHPYANIADRTRRVMDPNDPARAGNIPENRHAADGSGFEEPPRAPGDGNRRHQDNQQMGRQTNANVASSESSDSDQQQQQSSKSKKGKKPVKPRKP